ncbi:ATP-grasp domain-containing protein [Candidatus Sumerlaeota bacterium]|nr:ATP-grasp domain-containing protein [Candidatus Sumerlaeota bacterium]
MLNLLLTSVGRRSYLVKYFRDALKGIGKVHVANSSDVTPAFQEADEGVVTPLIYDDGYIPFLLEYCKQHQIGLLLSLFDIDLLILAQNKKKFQDIGVRVVVSDEAVIRICNDKWATYHFLTENGFNAPQTFVSMDEVTRKLEANELRFPLILKPRWGMGSIGIYEAENKQELFVLYEKIKRDIQKTYLKYESAEDREQSVLVQEKLDAQEYGLDVINDLDGVYQTTIVKRKFAMRSGETDCAVTEDNEPIRQIGARLSQCLKHLGNLDVDVLVVNDRIYVLEMNARFGGGYPFSHIAGCNLPQAIVNWQCARSADTLLNVEFGVKAHKDISILRIANRKA